MSFYEIFAIAASAVVFIAAWLAVREGHLSAFQGSMLAGVAALLLAAQMVAAYYDHKHRISSPSEQHVCSHSHSRAFTEIFGAGSHRHEVSDFNLDGCVSSDHAHEHYHNGNESGKIHSHSSEDSHGHHKDDHTHENTKTVIS